MNGVSVRKYREELVKGLCEAIEKGVAPWQRSWSEVEKEWPYNALTGHRYSGNNSVRLYLAQQKIFSTDPRWLTYKQAREMGAHVKSGEIGSYIMVYTYSGSFIPYVVFNGQQLEGLTPYVYDSTEKNVPAGCDKAERILRESGADIRHGGDGAFYVPSRDFINLPVIENFKTSADYYATALHELSHWTGHKSRLNRYMGGYFGSPKYAFEELVAEISSMFVSSETGIDQTKEHFDNHASYVGDWLEVIKEDRDALFKAAKLAHQATEEILKHERERERKDNLGTSMGASYFLCSWDTLSNF